MDRFTPTQEQIRLAELLFTAKAHEATVRPIVEAYETAILAKHQFRPDRIWIEHGIKDRPILDRKSSFLLSDMDSKVFFAECFAARKKAHLHVTREENCPLLEAEHLVIDAENALLKSVATIKGLEAFARPTWTLELRQKAIDLLLQLFAMYCDDAETILNRISQRS